MSTVSLNGVSYHLRVCPVSPTTVVALLAMSVSPLTIQTFIIPYIGFYSLPKVDKRLFRLTTASVYLVLLVV